jgi:hypothetical protein
LKLLIYATGNNPGSLNGSARTIMAQAMRALILLASATAATLIGRRSMMRASQSRRVGEIRALSYSSPACSRE